jgi:hypothetical protein
MRNKTGPKYSVDALSPVKITEMKPKGYCKKYVFHTAGRQHLETKSTKHPFHMPMPQRKREKNRSGNQ